METTSTPIVLTLDSKLDELGATAAGRSTEKLLAYAAALGPPDETQPYAASEALKSTRADRL